MKFLTLIPLPFWIAILIVVGAWWAFGVEGIMIAGLALLVFAVLS